MQVIFLLQNNMCMLECHGAAVSQGEPAVVVIKLQRFRVYTLRSATERNACVVRVSVNGGLRHHRSCNRDPFRERDYRSCA